MLRADVQCWARVAAAFGQKHQRKKRPIEEKESSKWLKSFRSVAEVQRRNPDTRIVKLVSGTESRTVMNCSRRLL